MVPKKYGGIYVYDSLNQGHQDYDVPPPHHNKLNRESAKQVEQTSRCLTRISDALQSYDVPSALWNSVPIHKNSDPSDNYDRLPAQTRYLSQASDSSMSKSSTTAVYDILPSNTTPDFDSDPTSLSNRSSTLSVFSTGSHLSTCSNHSSLSGSMLAQSSMDGSFQDIYDVPPGSRLICSSSDTSSQLYPVPEQDPSVKRSECVKTPIKRCTQSSVASPSGNKELSRQCSAGPPSYLKLHADRDSYLEDYSIPRCGVSQVCSMPGSDMSHGSGDSGISVSQVECFGSQCSCEIYDTPRKFTDDGLQGERKTQSLEENKENTYDVPRKLSQISDGRNISDERVGMDSCVNMSASSSHVTDSLFALHSNVLCHGSKVVDLINSGYSRSHQQELSQIKLACLALKAAIKEVIEFGNSLLSQITNPSCKGLSDRIFQLLEKVHIQFQYLNRHIDKLITTLWSVKHVDCGGGEISELDDNLNTIVMLTETVSARLLAFTKFIVQNSSSFTGGIPDISSDYDCANCGDTEALNDKLSLPLNEGISKTCSDSLEKQSVVQNRPLPPIPLLDSTQEESKNSKLLSSKAFVHGLNHATSTGDTGLQTGNLTEWNDECDYVSIATEAEKEMKAQEKLLGQQTSANSISDFSSEGTIADGGGITKVSFTIENNSNKLEPMNKFQNINDSPSLTNSLSCRNDEQKVKTASAVSVGPDQQLMTYYVEQIETNFATVDTAVREFFQMMFNERVTAKEFLLRSKFVILAAHKLVYIGDTITRNSINSSATTESGVAERANRLCDILKETVAATRASALNFPQNLAQQNLTECMKAVLQASRLLCEAIRLNAS